MKRLYVIVVAIFVSSGCYSQDVQNSESNDLVIESNYDIAPGTKLQSKFNTNVDYSSLMEKIDYSIDSYPKFDFFESYSEEGMIELESSNQDYQNYIQRLKNYYDSLSPRVKAVYSFKTIWYVFSYDQELKNKLISIK